MLSDPVDKANQIAMDSGLGSSLFW